MNNPNGAPSLFDDGQIGVGSTPLNANKMSQTTNLVDLMQIGRAHV